MITIKFQLKGVDPLSPKSPFDYKWVVPISFKTSAGTTYNVLLQNKVPLQTGRISKSLQWNFKPPENISESNPSSGMLNPWIDI